MVVTHKITEFKTGSDVVNSLARYEKSEQFHNSCFVAGETDQEV